MENAPHHQTESLCPVCLRRVRAARIFRGDDVFMVKECGEHGSFNTILWRGRPVMSGWRRPKPPVRALLCYGTVERGCPFDCGLCEAHIQIPCSVLIEVTDRCNLKCPFCFADSGRGGTCDLPLSDISYLLERAMAAAGPSNLQLSGGEPTLRDDLPEIIRIARNRGYSFIQVNTNGLRLASDWDYIRDLRSAGLSSVFLQFDGTDDAIYRALRGKALLEKKMQCIRNCGEEGIGVVLVPTLVKGINTENIGETVRLALQHTPAVRGIHFQPVSYFGRYPGPAGDHGRITLPEVMSALEEQTGGILRTGDFSPPGCEHELCSFHATYLRSHDGGLRLMAAQDRDTCCTGNPDTGGVKRTVDIISRRWTMPASPTISTAPSMSERGCPCCGKDRAIIRDEGPLDLDAFLREAGSRTFTVSAMAFQDAENIDLERLRACCISVISPDGMLVPFCAYNLTSRQGKGLYRGRNLAGEK